MSGLRGLWLGGISPGGDGRDKLAQFHWASAPQDGENRVELAEYP